MAAFGAHSTRHAAHGTHLAARSMEHTCGSCSSTEPWSLEKQLRIRPVGVVWKKESRARSTERSMLWLSSVLAARADANQKRLRNSDSTTTAAQHAARVTGRSTRIMSIVISSFFLSVSLVALLILWRNYRF